MARRSGQQSVGRSLKTLFLELSAIAIVLSVLYFVTQVMEVKAVEQYMDMFNVSKAYKNATRVYNQSMTFAVNMTNYSWGQNDVISLEWIENTTAPLPTERYFWNISHIGIYDNETFGVGATYNITFMTSGIVSGDYYMNEEGLITTVNTDITAIRSGYVTAKSIVTLALGLIGLVMVILIFAGYLLPVVQSIF